MKAWIHNAHDGGHCSILAGPHLQSPFSHMLLGIAIRQLKYCRIMILDCVTSEVYTTYHYYQIGAVSGIMTEAPPSTTILEPVM